MKKKVAIIGAVGTMGNNLVRNLAKAGYMLILFGRNKEKLDVLLKELHTYTTPTHIFIASSASEATQKADIIIPAVWYFQQSEIAREIRHASHHKIIINIANPLDIGYKKLLTAPDSSAAEDFARELPTAHIVKAFNTTFAGDFGKVNLGGKLIDCFVAGNDEEALKAVSQLVKDVGFNPVIAGDLSASRILESMMLLLIQVSQCYGYNWLAGWKILHQQA